MNRFFKAVDDGGQTLDVIIADNKERATTLMMFRPWHHCFLSFKVVEVGREEWIAWWKGYRVGSPSP